MPKRVTILTIKKKITDFLTKQGYKIGKFKKKDIKTGAIRKKTVMIKGKRRTRTQHQKASGYVANIGKQHTILIRRGGDNSYIVEVKLKKGKPKNEAFFISGDMVFDKTNQVLLLRNIKSVKPAVTKEHTNANRDFVTKLLFKGKKISLTGTMPGMKRADFVKMLKKLGAKFQNHMTKDMDLLIIGQKPGKTKTEYAKKHKIPTFRISKAFAQAFNNPENISIYHT